MKRKYETLDEYLVDLDAIKEIVAHETAGMGAQQVKAYFAGAAKALEKATTEKLQVRRSRRKASTTKR